MHLPVPRPQTVIFGEGTCLNQDIVFGYGDYGEEGYNLKITDRCVTITSSSNAGKYYALHTLAEIRRLNGRLPVLEITDIPKFKYRSFMYDAGRYFYSVADVKKLIEYCAEFKYNVFHFHLTEDQGWRFESDLYPRLTQISAYRKNTNGNLKPHGGFYTKAELIEIVSYAHQKHIIVVPEIDIPAHSRAAIAAYSELSCFNRKLEVANHWGVKYDILCAGKAFTYEFLDGVIGEIAKIFTDGYIHLGADEALKDRWKLCPDCQRTIRENGLMDEEGLQSFFINKVYERSVKSRGLKAIVWAYEDSAKALNPEIILEYYGGDKAKFIKSAQGRKVINADSNSFYLDFPYALTSLKKCYLADIDIDGVELIGGEVCLWTEYVPNIKRAEFLSYPRASAAAEIFWGSQSNYDDFECRMNATLKTFTNTAFACPKQYNPSGLRRMIGKLWWKRRPLHWEGFNNIIDNIKLKVQLKKNFKHKK